MGQYFIEAGTVQSPCWSKFFVVVHDRQIQSDASPLAGLTSVAAGIAAIPNLF